MSSLANSDCRVLITGGLGFIGSNLVKKCLDIGMRVTVYDNLDQKSGGKLLNVAPVENDIEILIKDITNYQDVMQAVKDKDVIINCAASTSHAFSMKEPWLNLEVNSRGVVNILEAVRRVNRTARIIHLGTTTQLGPLQYQPADENHPEFPLDIYSANKVVAEKYMLLYARTYELDITVIRLPNVYGPRAAIGSADLTFNNYFIGLAIQNKPITVYKPGNQLRNTLYVQDVIDAIMAAVQRNDRNSGGLFFATSDDHFTVKQIAEATCKILGGRVEMIDWPKDRRTLEPGDAVFTNSKIKQALGWEPTTSLEKGLRFTLDFFLDKAEFYLP
jgi:UDP-glucose 4-epimerase